MNFFHLQLYHMLYRHRFLSDLKFWYTSTVQLVFIVSSFPSRIVLFLNFVLLVGLDDDDDEATIN